MPLLSLPLFYGATNYVPNRMFSGRSTTRTHTLHYLSIGSILCRAAYFDNISGNPSKRSSRNLAGGLALTLIKCASLTFHVLLRSIVHADDRADGVPRWRNLCRFPAFMGVDFTDGSKWEDMSKVRHNQYFNVYY